MGALTGAALAAFPTYSIARADMNYNDDYNFSNISKDEYFDSNTRAIYKWNENKH